MDQSSENSYTSLSNDALPAILVAMAMQYFRQEHFSQALRSLQLIGEQKPTEHRRLITSINTFTQCCTAYTEAQLHLFDACKNFTEAQVAIHRQAMLMAEELQCLATEVEIGVARVTQEIAQNGLQTGRAYQALLAGTPHQLMINTAHVAQELERKQEGDQLPGLSITCFGRFSVTRLGKPLGLCNNRNGQAILRYLVAQKGYRASTDELADTFWPEDEFAVARRKLQVAVSLLRSALNADYSCKPGSGYILCHNGIYQLNPAISLQTDRDEFLDYYHQGMQQKERLPSLFEHACHLYTGPFLSEDLYAQWSFLQREQLAQMYLQMCSALAEHHLHNHNNHEALIWATAVVEENPCDERAHQILMSVYAASGRRSDVLRQYRRCQQLLKEELGLAPMAETQQVFESLFNSPDL